MKVEIEDEHYNEKTEKGTFIVSFKRIKGCQVFNGREKRELSIFINTYRKDIIQKWDRVFVDNKAITPVKVNKRLKKQGFLTKLLGL